jgi:cyclase
MLRNRVIPVLLIDSGRLVKTFRFRRPEYLGEPLNAVRIFNQKETDELIVLDISSGRQDSGPDMSMISNIAGECFMPLCYGGGISSLDHIAALIRSGIEKVSINTHSPIIRDAAREFGSSTIVASVDIKKDFFGRYRVFTRGRLLQKVKDPFDFMRSLESDGVGEILLNNVDLDGTMQGYDLELIAKASEAVSVPIVACGGAGTLRDMALALQAKASAVAAGSFFVYHGKHRAVLIQYPEPTEIDGLMKNH